MKLTKFLKTMAISVCLAASFATAGLTMTGCGDDEDPSDKYAGIDNAINAAVSFLTSAKNSGNYSSVSEYADGSVYEYYADDGKIKCVYNETFYAVKEGFDLYKIYQADDGTWHKNNDDTDLIDPEDRMTKLIITVDRTNIWNKYDNKTNTLTCVASDGTITLSLDEGVLTYAFNYNSGDTIKHTIKDVGNTTVALPEDVIDDTE